MGIGYWSMNGQLLSPKKPYRSISKCDSK